MNASQKMWTAALAGVAATVALSGGARAQSADALIDKLVDKGVLSVKEANELREEADKDFAKAYSVKSGMPDWVTSLKINGDFRARYDGFYQHSSNAGNPPTFAGPVQTGPWVEDRHRLQYRARLGFTAVMSDQFEVGFRFASGDGVAGNANPVSTNTTLDNNGTKKAVNFDLAYAKWTPREWLMVEYGKMNNELWMTDMVFDGDYNPEGGQEKLMWSVNEKHALALTAGQFVVDENAAPSGVAVFPAMANNNDTYAFLNQVDWTAKWSPKFSSRLAFGMVNFLNQSDNTQTTAPGSNNVNGNQAMVTAVGPNLNPLIARAELVYTLDSFPLFDGPFPITPMFEYANNFTADQANEAYNVGVIFGSNKTKGNWQVSYNYKNIEMNSVWSAWNDSDFGVRGSGGTNVRGHVIRFSYRPANPLLISFYYAMTENISPTATALGGAMAGVNAGNQIAGRERQDRLIFDLIWSF